MYLGVNSRRSGRNSVGRMRAPWSEVSNELMEWINYGGNQAATHMIFDDAILVIAGHCPI